MTNRIRAAVLALILLAGCTSKQVERESTDPNIFQAFEPSRIAQLKKSSPYLKAHMKNGNVYVFRSWRTDSITTGITGNAILYGPSRDALAQGEFALAYDSIAILESNVLKTSGSAVAMNVFTGITLAVAAICVANPKACFGSCPTFYVSDGDTMRLQGEGFSSSVAPSLEASDVDALYRARPKNGEVDVLMKNEALETHVVRWVDLLAVPILEDCRVFASANGTFWESPLQIPPRSAQAPEGDCPSQLLNVDGRERFSYADVHDLATKETIELKFDAHPGRTYGLVVACRQSLLPTYLLYQTFAYMGSSAGEWMAEIERGKFPRGAVNMERLIGGIDASIRQPDGSWRPEGTIAEHGPLAVDVHLLPLTGVSDSTVTVRLEMTKGTWRIDYVALAELSRPLSPIRIAPSSVIREGNEDTEALKKLCDSSKVLVTLPGDSYLLKYILPRKNTHYELFLESRGYYIEWIRKEWLEEENPILLSQMFLDPAGSLKRMAPEFKRVELQMEDCFWRSRYGNQ